MSTIKPYVTILFLLLAFTLQADDNSSRYFGEYLSSANGLPGNTIKAITQDEACQIASGSKMSQCGSFLFRQQLEALVTEHLSDPALSVDLLAGLMHIGRTRFYGKVRNLFGMSPNKYITNRRLEKAARLLAEGRYNVTEVAYQVGFTTATYFYKCFKQKYGVMPSKYKG